MTLETHGQTIKLEAELPKSVFVLVVFFFICQHQSDTKTLMFMLPISDNCCEIMHDTKESFYKYTRKLDDTIFCPQKLCLSLTSAAIKTNLEKK